MTDLFTDERDIVDETILNLRERVEAIFGAYEGGYKLDATRALQVAENANVSAWHRHEARSIVNLLHELIVRWEMDMEEELRD